MMTVKGLAGFFLLSLTTFANAQPDEAKAVIPVDTPCREHLVVQHTLKEIALPKRKQRITDRPSLSSLVLLMATAMCLAAPASAKKPGPRVVVLSYNIHHAQGMDGKLDLERIAQIIRSVSPDIVALQEIDKHTKRAHGVDQAKTLSRLTNMEALYCPSFPFQGGEYGNAILSRHPVKKVTRLPLPGEPRSALYVTVEMTNTFSFTFVATHLDLSEKARLDSIPLIEQFFATEPDTPAILAGDLNAQPGSTTIQALERTWKNATDSQDFFTYPSKKPGKQIDFILYRPTDAWRVVETKVLNEPVASDHCPILAVLEWGGTISP